MLSRVARPPPEFPMRLEADDLRALTGILQPQMTASTSNGYVASASSVLNNSTDLIAASAFDGTSTTIWHSELTYSSGAYTGSVSTTVDGSPIAGEWLQLQLPRRARLARHGIIPRTNIPGRAPQNFVVAGSNDGTTWTAVNARTSASYANNTVTWFTVASSAGAYSYYRLIATTMSPSPTDPGVNNSVNITEWQFDVAAQQGVLNWGGAAQSVTAQPPLTGILAPQMTTNNSNGYAARASSVHNNLAIHVAAASFDGNATTFWHSSVLYNNGTYTGSVSTTVDGSPVAGEWLQLQLPRRARLTRHGIVPAIQVIRSPQVFVVAGSNNGTTWTAVDSRSAANYVYTNNTTTWFSVTSSVEYAYYRLICTTLGTSGTTANIAEWQFDVAAQSALDLQPLWSNAGGFYDLPYVSFTNGSTYLARTTRVRAATRGGFTTVFQLKFRGAATADEELLNMYTPGLSGGDDRAVLRRDSTGRAVVFQMQLAPTLLSLTSVANVITQNQWTVLVARYSAATRVLDLKRNDVAAGTVVAGAAAIDTAAMPTFAYVGSPTNQANVDVRSVSVWDRYLTDAQLTAEYARLANPLGARAVLDASALALSAPGSGVSAWGTPTALTQATESAKPTYDAAGHVSFNAANSTNLSATLTLNPVSNGGLTVIAHMRRTATMTTSFVLNTSIGLQFQQYFSTLAFGLNSSSGMIATTTNGPVVLNEWAVFAARYTHATSTVQIYKNNVAQPTSGSLVQNMAANIYNATQTVYVGGQQQGATGYFFTGDIRSVQVWDRALSDAEMTSVYAQMTS